MKRYILFVILILSVTAFTAAAQETEAKKPIIDTTPLEFPVWSATSSLGYATTGQRIRTNTFTGDLGFAREGDRTGQSLSGNVAYGTVSYSGGDPIKTATYYGGKYRFEGYVHPSRKPYLWVSPAAESDQLQGYWGRYTAEGGPGINFFGRIKPVLKFEVGYAFVNTNWIERKEIEDGEFHYWEPTHNGVARLIASLPIYDTFTLTEETVYRHDVTDEDNYNIKSDTGLTIKLTEKLSFKTTFNVTYTNQPGLVEKLNNDGTTATVDDDGDPTTPEVTVYEPANRASYGFTNALVLTF